MSDTAQGRTSRFLEIRRGWPALLAAAFGSGVGINGLMAYNLGLFVQPLSREIGLTRGQFGSAVSASMMVMALALLFVGPLVDRLGGRRVAIVGSAGFSLIFVAMSMMVQSTAAFFALVVAMGAVGSATTAISYSRVVVTWFDSAQGLALALVMTGIGLASMIVPPLVALVIEGAGWQAGFRLLAVLAASSIPVSLLLLRPAPAARAPSMAAPIAASADRPASSAAARAALRSRIFWLQGGAFFLMSLAVTGVMIHFVPLFTDLRLSATAAAGLMSLFGATLVCSRLLVGWLADRVHAPWIAVVTCVAAGGACLLLATGSTAVLPLAAILIGTAIGAETDLLAYLTARYFGVIVYGRCFAWQYGLFVVAAGLSPAWIGILRDQSGSYAQPLFLASLLSLAAAIAFACLPRYARLGAPLFGQRQKTGVECADGAVR